MIDSQREAEPAPEPDAAADVRRYAACEVIRVNLYIHGAFYRGIARASYRTPAGRLAYDLLLWPGPRQSPSGWYWFDETWMRRRMYPGAGSRP
ncbi:hypothetical protein [Streptomyces sp. NPDC005244]|uniref:hypothetical protein n=1 Tax=Streptomyces sp. NPDC005244 TaxID=3364708 RepID=UPI0036B34CA9